MPKLCIGSANFGNNYGYKNLKVENIEIKKLLNFAVDNKVYHIDTSFHYKNSHKFLLKNWHHKFKINTKIKIKKTDKENLIFEKVNNLKKNTKKKINSILFHDQNDSYDRKKINILKYLKKKNR